MEDFLAYVVALDAERLLNTSHESRRAVLFALARCANPGCVFRCIRSAVPGASDQDSGDPIRNRSEATRTGAGQTVG